MQKNQPTRQKTKRTNKSPQRSSDQISSDNSQAKTKKISQHATLCIVLQIISLGEYACILMSIHTFLFNSYKTQFGLQLSFFLVSKIIKIVYYSIKKQYIQVVLVILCLDYIAAYLVIKKERKNNKQTEEADKVVRQEWVTLKNYQQKKIDQYLQNLSSVKPNQNSKQKNDQMKQLPISVKKTPDNTRIDTPPLNTNMTQLPAKGTISTLVNNTEGTQKDQNLLYNLQNKQIIKLGTGLNSDGRSPNQDIEFFKTNLVHQNAAQQYLQTEEKSVENAMITKNNNQPNQFISKIDEFRNSQTLKNNLQLSIQNSQEINSKHSFQNDYRPKQLTQYSPNKFKDQNRQSGKLDVTSETQKKAQKTKERVLEYQIQSSVLRKLKLNKSQLHNLIYSKFTTVYIEEEADEQNENYFMKRKFLISLTKIFDGIFMDAPCLYILTYVIANHLDLVKLYPLLKAGYWYISVCLSISICLFNNLQNIPFRQHDNYFKIQLKSFIKNFCIVFCIVISTTVLWAFSSLSGTALLIYDISIFCIIDHQVFSFMTTVYKEEARGDFKFKLYLFLICFCFSLFVGSLLLFANLILLLNSDLAHEALLQLRRQLESPDPKLGREDLFQLVERAKYGFSFLQRQNFFFILNMIGLALISIFANQLYNQSWNSQVIDYHKILLGCMPICLLGILLQHQDTSFFSTTLSKIVFDHYNQVVLNIKNLRIKIRVKQLNEQKIQKQFQEIDDKIKALKQKFDKQEQQKKEFEIEEAKLIKQVKMQYVAKNQRNQLELKLLTTRKIINETKEQQGKLKLEIESVDTIYEERNKLQQEAKDNTKAIQDELENYAKVNGINLQEEIIMGEEEIEKEALLLQFQEYQAELKKNQQNQEQQQQQQIAQNRSNPSSPYNPNQFRGHNPINNQQMYQNQPRYGIGVGAGITNNAYKPYNQNVQTSRDLQSSQAYYQNNYQNYQQNYHQYYQAQYQNQLPQQYNTQNVNANHNSNYYNQNQMPYTQQSYYKQDIP